MTINSSVQHDSMYSFLRIEKKRGWKHIGRDFYLRKAPK